METKRWTKSRTIATGATITAIGILAVILEIVGAIDISQLTPEVEKWVSLAKSGIVSVAGLIMLYLRTKTSLPIARTKAGRKLVAMLPSRADAERRRQ